MWIPEDSPHISITGLTGSGKSYLVRHGLLPLLPWDRVCVLDMKGGDDKTLIGLGKTVKQLPTWQRSMRSMVTKDEPYGNWYRLMVSEDIRRGQEQLHEAFTRMWREGEWFIVVDELRALVEVPGREGYGMVGWWNRFMMRGRSKSISVINLTQEPKWVPGLFYSQPSFSFVGRIEDEATHKRIAEIGSTKALLPHLSRIRKRTWLYTDNLEDERFFALSGLT